MRIRLSTLVTGVVALFVAVVVTAIAILYSTDFNAYKKEIGTLVRDATGRNLVIEGDLQLNMGLTPSVAAERLKFSNASWDSRKQMAQVGRLRAELELFPALLGEVKIKQVVLSDADILLETPADGSGNWVMGEPQSAAKKNSADRPSSVPTFENVLIENSRIAWRNGKTGKTQTVVIDRFHASAESVATPLRFNIEGSFGDLPITLRGETGSLETLISGGALPLDLTDASGDAEISIKGGMQHPTQGDGVNVTLTATAKNLSSLGRLIDSELPSVGPFRMLHAGDRGFRRVGLLGRASAQQSVSVLPRNSA